MLRSIFASFRSSIPTFRPSTGSIRIGFRTVVADTFCQDETKESACADTRPKKSITMRVAFRRLWRFRPSSLLSVVLLGLGIGASMGVFSVANAYVFEPMFPGQDRLFVFWPELRNGNRAEISYPEFFEWKDELKSFSELAVMWSSTMERAFGRRGNLDIARFRWVSASFFDTLGVIVVMVLASALGASQIPAARASRISPAEALRHL